jgi:hypothetical protein
VTREDLDLYLQLKKQFDEECDQIAGLISTIQGYHLTYDTVDIDGDLLYFRSYENWLWGDSGCNFPLSYLTNPASRAELEEKARTVIKQKEQKKKDRREKARMKQEDKDKAKLAELLEKYGIPNPPETPES